MLHRVLGGAFLVSGTAIGAVTIVLPVVISAWGMVWGTFIYTLMWLVMMLTGLYIAEVSYHFDKPVGFLSMIDALLGRRIYVLSWFVFLCLLYSLVAAYLSGLADILSSYAPLDSFGYSSLVMPGLMMGAVLLLIGQEFANFVNRLALVSLIMGFIIMVLVFCSAENHYFHFKADFNYLLRDSLSVLVAFGFQVVIPSLRIYLKSDPIDTKKSIIYGSLLALVIYIAWSIGLLSVLPFSGPDSIETLQSSADPIRILPAMLARLTGNTWSGTWIQLFLVASLVSSYIGILLSLFHFIQDGLKLTNSMGHRIVLTLITLAPPWLFGQYYPHGFLIALSYAGLFVCILNVVLPVVMVSLLRYRKMATTYRAPGGWCGIYFCSLIVFVFIAYEVTRIQIL